MERFFNIKRERLHVIYNGDRSGRIPTGDQQGVAGAICDQRDEPYVLFVGRITRQKGIIHLVNAIRHLNPGFQIVLCAGAPDTPEIAAEMKQAVAKA